MAMQDEEYQAAARRISIKLDNIYHAMTAKAANPSEKSKVFGLALHTLSTVEKTDFSDVDNRTRFLAALALLNPKNNFRSLVLQEYIKSGAALWVQAELSKRDLSGDFKIIEEHIKAIDAQQPNPEPLKERVAHALHDLDEISKSDLGIMPRKNMWENRKVAFAKRAAIAVTATAIGLGTVGRPLVRSMRGIPEPTGIQKIHGKEVYYYNMVDEENAINGRELNSQGNLTNEQFDLLSGIEAAWNYSADPKNITEQRDFRRQLEDLSKRPPDFAYPVLARLILEAVQDKRSLEFVTQIRKECPLAENIEYMGAGRQSLTIDDMIKSRANNISTRNAEKARAR